MPTYRSEISEYMVAGKEGVREVVCEGGHPRCPCSRLEVVLCLLEDRTELPAQYWLLFAANSLAGRRSCTVARRVEQ